MGGLVVSHRNPFLNWCIDRIAKCGRFTARYLQRCISVRETNDRRTEQTPRSGLTGD